MCEDGTEKIKTFTSVVGLFRGTNASCVYGGWQLSAKSGDVKG